MAKPDNAASPDTFEDRVTQVINQASKGEDGKTRLPEGTPEDVAFAANAELRRRETQSVYTKASQEVARLKAESEALKKLTEGNLRVSLTSDQELELEGLKHTDPEQWRLKANQYEAEARDKHTKEVDERVKNAAQKGVMEAELELRRTVLERYKADNPGFELTDDIIANELPPRISRELANGDITFEEFLQQAKDYLSAGRVVGSGSRASEEPNLSKAGGDSNPSQDASSKSSQESYDSEVY